MGLKRLFIDLEKLTDHMKNCTDRCSYFYHPHNSGITNVWELATYALVCRKCEDENCVRACPTDALEKQEDKVLKRYNMRCTSCKSCAHACHSGTIYAEFVPYYVSSCDFCLNRLNWNDKPECVQNCRCGAIQYGEFKEDEAKNVYAVGENLLVRSTQWERNGVKKK